MVAMDLGGIEQALGTSVDAVIGLDLLGRQNFTIDYRRRKIVFHTSSRPAGAIAFEMKHESAYRLRAVARNLKCCWILAQRT